MQRPAKPCRPVRLRLAPPGRKSKSPANAGLLLFPNPLHPCKKVAQSGTKSPLTTEETRATTPKPALWPYSRLHHLGRTCFVWRRICQQRICDSPARLSSGLDWAECIDRYDRPHTLFYLDPPYLDTAGYGVSFPFEQYEKMADHLRTLKGRAIVSLNDHPEIRRVFDGFQIETVPIQYTIGLEAASRHEVSISSSDVGAEPAGLF